MSSPASRSLSFLCALGALLLSAPSLASAQPAFSASFDPPAIGPDSVALVRFVIDNGASGTPAGSLGFTATLPARVTLTSPAVASSTCVDAQLDAPSGGSTLALTDVRLGGSSSCTVTAYVTSSAVGGHVLVTGDLTSSAGNSGTASATLTVDANRPGVTLSASPASVPWQGRTTLTYTFDNSASASFAFNLGLTHMLPAGVTIASPARASTTCGGTVTAVAGGQSLTSSGGSLLGAGSSCTVEVDVRVGLVGTFLLVSEPATASAGGPSLTLGRAATSLTGTTDLALLKVDFLADPAAAGSTLTLAYTLYNRDRNNELTGLAFQHDLGATLAGLAATSVSANDCGGTVTPGATVNVSGVTLASGEECHIAVDVTVPNGAASGVYASTTSTLAANPSATTVGPAGADILEVLAGPRVTIALSPDPVGVGDVLTAEFTVENVSPTEGLTAIAFNAVIDDFLPGAMWTVPATPCGAGSNASISGGFPLAFVISNGSLAAGASCTFSFTTTVPRGTPSSVQTLDTTVPSGQLSGQPVSGASTGDSVTVLAPPHLALDLAEGTLAAGESTTLSLTLTNNENGAMTTALAFDLLEVMGLAGLTYSALPAAGFCGAGSSASPGTSPALVSFSGLSLAVGASCTFDVTVDVPAAATPGAYSLTTSDVNATVGSVMSVADGRAVTLNVAVLRPTLDVVDDPALAGNAVTLRFAFENVSSTGSISGLVGTVNLSSALAGLAAVGLPANDVCGAGSQITGTTSLVLTGGSLAPSESCSFDVTLQVPAGAADGQYGIVTSAFSSMFDGSPLATPAVNAELLVGSPLMLAIALPGGPARAGGDTTLDVTLANAGSAAATALAFTLDLDAAFPGLVVSALPSGGECGGAVIAGTSVLSVTGGSLPAAGSCTFVVTLTLPNTPGPVGGATLLTSDLTGTVAGLAASASAASASLLVHSVDVTLPAETTLEAGGDAQLTLTLTNFTGAMVGEASFTLPLTALPSGVTVTDIVFDAACGGAVSVTGTSTLAFRASGLDAAQSCAITLSLAALGNTVAGDVVLTTSSVNNSGGTVGLGSTGTLHILPPSVPSFGLAVTPNTVTPGDRATLTYILTNAGSTIALSGLGFTHALPSGVSVVSGGSVTNDCGGTLDAVGASVTFVDGVLAAVTTCTITVEVSASALGVYTLTPSDLSSSRGALAAPTATLTVIAVLVDAGVDPDGSVLPDGSMLLDGSVTRDGGTTLGGGGSGCGCRVTTTNERGGLGWAALSLVAALVVRRRRRGR